MPKYYVQSGSFRGIVARQNAQAAARWAVESVMKQAKAIDLDSNDAQIGLFRLGKYIGVSQRGFDRKQRQKFATSDAVRDWMIAQQASEQI
ncbi:MAG: hypothetical protein ACKN85_03085 [Pirellula sp.]